MAGEGKCDKLTAKAIELTATLAEAEWDEQADTILWPSLMIEQAEHTGQSLTSPLVQQFPTNNFAVARSGQTCGSFSNLFFWPAEAIFF